MDTEKTAGPSQGAAIRLGGTLLAGGSMHFLAPKFFDDIIPPVLPGKPRTYTYVAGTAALAIGAGLLVPRTRRVSAGLAGTYFVAVMPAKIQLAVDWWRSDTKRLPAKLLGIAQLFWQVPLVTEALKARRDAPRNGRLAQATGGSPATQPPWATAKSSKVAEVS